MSLNEWQKKVDDCAKIMSKNMEDNFTSQARIAFDHLPRVIEINNPHSVLDAQVWHLNTFIEYLVMTTVGIISKHVDINDELKNNVLASVNTKFEEIKDLKSRGLIK